MAKRNLRETENIELIIESDRIANEILGGGRWSSHRENFYPKLIDKMNYKIGVEIGTDQGFYAECLLKSSKLEKLYCVDIWYNEDKFIETQERLKPYIDSGRVELIRKLSVDAVNSFDNNSIDFVYIDGDHSLEGIYQDVRAWVHKVKIGGCMSGHDYKDGRSSGTFDWFGYFLRNKVKIVMDDFCPRYGYHLRTIQSRVLNWYFIKNKECECQLRLNY